jgi:hypothetical protein
MLRSSSEIRLIGDALSECEKFSDACEEWINGAPRNEKEGSIGRYISIICSGSNRIGSPKQPVASRIYELPLSTVKYLLKHWKTITDDGYEFDEKDLRFARAWSSWRRRFYSKTLDKTRKDMQEWLGNKDVHGPGWEHVWLQGICYGISGFEAELTQDRLEKFIADAERKKAASRTT